MTKWAPPTMRECFDAAVSNESEAAKHLKMARARVARLMPGDNELPDAKAAVQQYLAEVAHWGEYVTYYRKRCEVEGDLTVPRMLNKGSLSA